MDKQVLYVSLVSGFLGLLSVILGFTAEVTKINATDVYIGDFYCYYPSSPAFGTAITAMLFLVLAQILVTVFGGFCGCCKKDPTAPVVYGTKRTLTLVFVIISWITFAISVILFILGAGRNGTGNQTTSLDNCYVVKPGIFAGAAICALFTMTFSITSYILLNPSIDAASKPTGVQYANGIAMGSPQFPHTQQQYPDPGMGGTQYPEPGVGGTQYPEPGVGGTQYPAPGVGGTQYPPPGTNYSTV
ncbi:hypothetical protein FCM35_KLT20422 [Carex littledalei]|uniref:Uncharacterized protein n=1 Tax=Carex littledalei TaxID=544730 RepID=A0A833QVM4_9POAL|nr:hypothetical protein FCM35_KLT20422 [Carex littledalei]